MKKLICFDLDGTLTPKSTWEALNLKLGISPEDDYRLYKEYANGTLEYLTWTKSLVDLHKAAGVAVSKQDIAALVDAMPIALGAAEAVQSAKEKGYDLLLLSGSVDTVVEAFATRLGIGEWRACTKAVYDDAGAFIGFESMGDESPAKLELLQAFCSEHGYALADVISIGDGGNERAIFERTRGILVGNKPELADVAWKHVPGLADVDALI